MIIQISPGKILIEGVFVAADWVQFQHYCLDWKYRKNDFYNWPFEKDLFELDTEVCQIIYGGECEICNPK